MDPDATRGQRRLRALAHPARLQMLSLVAGTNKSGAELGREMGMSQPAASYHLRVLADSGLVIHTQTRGVRGGQEKLFGLAPGSRGGDDQVDLFAGVVAAALEVVRSRPA